MEQLLVMVVYTTEKQKNDETCKGFGKGWILQHFYLLIPPPLSLCRAFQENSCPHYSGFKIGCCFGATCFDGKSPNVHMKCCNACVCYN